MIQGTFSQNHSLPPEMFEICHSTEGSYEVFDVDREDGWVAFNIISAAGLNLFAVAIDEHPMWVYEVDGRRIEPYMVHVLPMEPANRYSVLVQLNKAAGNYRFRVHTKTVRQTLTSSGTLRYRGSGTGITARSYIDRFGSPVSRPGRIRRQEGPPLSATSPGTGSRPNSVFGRRSTRSGVPVDAKWQGQISGGRRGRKLYAASFRPGFRDRDLTLALRNGTWVDIIFRAALPNAPHPIYKHTNRVFVIGSGTGNFTYSFVAEAYAAIPKNFNLQNPIIRDGWLSPGAGVNGTWIAVRYQVVAPGPSLMHCHVQNHFMGGMGVTIMEGIDVWPTVPPEYLDGNGITPQTDLGDFEVL
jgi:hypothetical protein